MTLCSVGRSVLTRTLVRGLLVMSLIETFPRMLLPLRAHCPISVRRSRAFADTIISQPIGETHASLHHAINAGDRRTAERDRASADQEPVRDNRRGIFPQVGGQGFHAHCRVAGAEEL